MAGTPPEGAVATKDDFQIGRDAEGEIVPVWEPIPGSSVECSDCDGVGCETCGGSGDVRKHVKVRPMTQGDAEKYLPQSGEPGDLEDRMVCKLINDFFVEPSWDLDESDAKSEIESFSAFGVYPLIMALYNASGFETMSGMMLENSDFIEAVEGNSSDGS